MSKFIYNHANELEIYFPHNNIRYYGSLTNGKTYKYKRKNINTDTIVIVIRYILKKYDLKILKFDEEYKCIIHKEIKFNFILKKYKNIWDNIKKKNLKNIISHSEFKNLWMIFRMYDKPFYIQYQY